MIRIADIQRAKERAQNLQLQGKNKEAEKAWQDYENKKNLRNGKFEGFGGD